MDIDRRYMRRALQLAACGYGHVSPNPMVGAVIVCDGRIIGEGWHRKYGEGHAEVNAIASVTQQALLGRSTMYVTLEPCSHYGKTPPCAGLLIDKGVKRVVVATLDPFEKVSGRGVKMLRDAGIDVCVGMLEAEARELNRRFFTAHTLHRPYVLLKWAQSADGFLDRQREISDSPTRFSDSSGRQKVHMLRAGFDAIMVGSGTVIMDNPRLDVRDVCGKSPRAVVIDRRGRVPASATVLARPGTICFGASRSDLAPTVETCCTVDSLPDILHYLYSLGVTSLMVEGGKQLIDSFVAEDLWDDCRVEISPICLGSAGVKRMTMPHGVITSTVSAGKNAIVCIRHE